ncbi:hypothetical protein UB46_18595 [Burkholderiaceae bacterium 16]|nr:hypothetical protein UB46_18595 [Burkholderiaceae bacterium 16]
MAGLKGRHHAALAAAIGFAWMTASRFPIRRRVRRPWMSMVQASFAMPASMRGAIQNGAAALWRRLSSMNWTSGSIEALRIC